MSLDNIIDFAYTVCFYLGAFWKYLQSVCLLHPYGLREIIFVMNALNGALNVHAAHKGQDLYWLHSFVLTILGGFSGGFLTPVLLGKPSVILNNDLVIISCLVAWYTVFYLSGHIWLNYPPIKTVWLIFVAIFRTVSITNMVQFANGICVASTYYPSPIFGPIIAGTMNGCFGMFVPFDKSLTALKNNTHWNIQGAIITAIFYHFMINDTKGFVGHTFRSVFGTLSRPTVLVIIFFIHLIHVQLQYWISVDMNLFAPIHKLLYLITQVEGPKTGAATTKDSVGLDRVARSRMQYVIDITRIAAIVGAMLGHIYYCVSPPRLRAQSLPSTMPLTYRLSTPHKVILPEATYESFAIHSLPIGESIGTCQFLSDIRSCTPYVLRFEPYSCQAHPTHHSTDCERLGSAEKEIYRLAIYQASIFKWNVKRELKYQIPIATYPLAFTHIFDTMVTPEISYSAIQNAPTHLQITTEGQLVLVKPIRSINQNVTILYSHVGTMTSLLTEGIPSSHTLGKGSSSGSTTSAVSKTSKGTTLTTLPSFCEFVASENASSQTLATTATPVTTSTSSSLSSSAAVVTSQQAHYSEESSDNAYMESILSHLELQGGSGSLVGVCKMVMTSALSDL